MSETLSAIASLLWPLIVLAIIVVFRGPLARVIRSTESRDVTIKIAGQEVTLGELHRQQMDMMSDLHQQIATLHKDISGTPAPAAPKPGTPARQPAAPKVVAAAKAPAFSGATSTEPPAFDVDHADPVKAPWERLEHHEPADQEPPDQKPFTVVPAPADDELLPGWTGERPDTRPKAAGVLWVADHPERQALQIDHLERRGVVVDVVHSTKEALQKLTGQRYQLIVSGMDRVEGGKPVPDAGLELIRTVRTFDRDTPVVIYGAGHGGRPLGDTATQIGADLVTNSWYQLSEEMHRIGVL